MNIFFTNALQLFLGGVFRISSKLNPAPRQFLRAMTHLFSTKFFQFSARGLRHENGDAQEKTIHIMLSKIDGERGFSMNERKRKKGEKGV